MRDGTVYIRTYAISMVREGKSPEEALKLAKEAWARRIDAEQVIDALMAKEG